MTCRDLERWLDDGGAPERYVEAMAHARICAHCSAALGTVDEMETLLAMRTAAAPAGFATRVMARVALTPQMPTRIPVTELLPFFQTVPWWVRLALEPASLLALLLASVLVWRGDMLFALASSGAVQLAAWLAQSLPASGPGPVPAVDPGPVAVIWLQPVVLTCIALGAAPLALMGSRLLYRWSAALAGPHHTRPVGR
jgi:hypothetical protein